MRKELVINTDGHGLALLLEVINTIKQAETIKDFSKKPLDFQIKILVLNDIKQQLEKKCNISNLQKEKLKLKFQPSQALALHWLLPYVMQVLELRPLELVSITEWNQQLDQYYKSI